MECKGKSKENCEKCPQKFLGLEGKCRRKFTISVNKDYVVYAATAEEALELFHKGEHREKANE